MGCLVWYMYKVKIDVILRKEWLFTASVMAKANFVLSKIDEWEVVQKVLSFTLKKQLNIFVVATHYFL